MTVRQIIEEIEALPSEQRRELLGVLVKKEVEQTEGTPSVKYADHDEAMRMAERIFTERAELFKKLAA
jgi:hypothetical protein